MVLKQIQLTNFRNYSKKSFDFGEGINLVVGENAVGKTNLLEAIYLLASGRSFRVKSVEREMIQYGQEIARVIGQIGLIGPIGQIGENKSKTIKNLEIVLTMGEVQGEKAGKKKYLVEGVPKRGFDFIGNFRAVYFGPEDLEIVTDSPSLRRKYLDSVLVQVDREYARCLLAYEKGIRARNRLLEGIREESNGRWEGGGEKLDDEMGSAIADSKRRLYFWDQLVIKNGRIITERRGRFIDFLNNNLLTNSVGLDADNADKLHADNTDIPNGAFSGLNSQFSIEYDKSLISEERLKQYEREEVASATTLVGPHRDDFSIRIKNSEDRIKHDDRDLSIYGSRGEQRLAVLWLKLGELAYIEKETKDKPVLLLDDIFSELDEGHRELVMDLVGKQQTIITTADEEVRDRVRDRAGKVRIMNVS